jgi:uncharacterized protein (TIGR02611 family)
MTGMNKERASSESPPDDAEVQQDSDETPVDPRTWVHRMRARRDSIRRRPHAYRAYRIVVGIVGGAISLGGLALIPLPGPGWVIVFIGLAVLATEFEWAARLEKFARDQVSSWTQWLGRQSLPIRALIALITVIFVIGVMYAIFATLGVPGWVPDSWIPNLPGL